MLCKEGRVASNHSPRWRALGNDQALINPKTKSGPDQMSRSDITAECTKIKLVFFVLDPRAPFEIYVGCLWGVRISGISRFGRNPVLPAE